MELGLDIVEIGRIKSLARRERRFLKRVFTNEEIAYCMGKKNPWQHFAVRFAAKEAVWKALDQSGLGLKDISVGRGARGKPAVLLKGKAVRSLKLSLSHSEHYAVAVAMKVK
ncbi:MAG: holo-ACP synthase [Elusimicrobiota bacterium]